MKVVGQMVLNINIKPETEARLASRARSTGLSLEVFVQEILNRGAAAETLKSPELGGAEKAKAFRIWADSFPANVPVLSLDDLSRESMYRPD